MRGQQIACKHVLHCYYWWWSLNLWSLLICSRVSCNFPLYHWLWGKDAWSYDVWTSLQLRILRTHIRKMVNHCQFLLSRVFHMLQTFSLVFPLLALSLSSILLLPLDIPLSCQSLLDYNVRLWTPEINWHDLPWISWYIGHLNGFLSVLFCGELTFIAFANNNFSHSVHLREPIILT